METYGWADVHRHPDQSFFDGERNRGGEAVFACYDDYGPTAVTMDDLPGQHGHDQHAKSDGHASFLDGSTGSDDGSRLGSLSPDDHLIVDVTSIHHHHGGRPYPENQSIYSPWPHHQHQHDPMNSGYGSLSGVYVDQHPLSDGDVGYPGSAGSQETLASGGGGVGRGSRRRKSVAELTELGVESTTSSVRRNKGERKRPLRSVTTIDDPGNFPGLYLY
jgi:hypothetical protein